MYYAWHSCRRQFSPKINRKSWSLNERPSAQNLWIPMPKCWNILTDSFWVVHQNLPKFQKLNFDENISEKLITYELWVQQHQFLEIFNKMSKRAKIHPPRPTFVRSFVRSVSFFLCHECRQRQYCLKFERSLSSVRLVHRGQTFHSSWLTPRIAFTVDVFRRLALLRPRTTDGPSEAGSLYLYTSELGTTPPPELYTSRLLYNRLRQNRLRYNISYRNIVHHWKQEFCTT